MWRTDGQTDSHLSTAKTALTHSIARVKNRTMQNYGWTLQLLHCILLRRENVFKENSRSCLAIMLTFEIFTCYIQNVHLFNSIQLVQFRQSGPYKNMRDRWTDRKQQTGRTAQRKNTRNMRRRLSVLLVAPAMRTAVRGRTLPGWRAKQPVAF